ncbi:hypothetical protein L873DRAFT_272039 [Choiromyces venosus 120613-1]|uniref:Uncharacterized protein n=1 Tax=Choiromyces venosus 120613-1 TaxID=1336337 RepID=A0A3N4J584_9PEZI|nr:hypothetical protein L873DRAFT_272039 [Choiromyces venosus 120613-1]
MISSHQSIHVFFISCRFSINFSSPTFIALSIISAILFFVTLTSFLFSLLSLYSLPPLLSLLLPLLLDFFPSASSPDLFPLHFFFLFLHPSYHFKFFIIVIIVTFSLLLTRFFCTLTFPPYFLLNKMTLHTLSNYPLLWFFLSNCILSFLSISSFSLL